MDGGELGDLAGPVRRERKLDVFLPKIEEWVDRSDGKIRADVCHEKLEALGYDGSDRTVRRAVGGGEGVVSVGPPEGVSTVDRRTRACGPSGTGERARGSAAGPRTLWCGWLAWCRHRVVIPTSDRTLPTVIACLDSSMRRWGGAPTFWLTDNERTVTIDHVAGIAVRHPLIVAAGKHYGVTIATCVPADPESKGGLGGDCPRGEGRSGPNRHEPARQLRDWAELVDACERFMTKVNGREHRITRRVPDEMLVEEAQRLHRLPDVAYTAAFGETRKVSWSATISYGGVTYSVPHTLVDDQVWVRVDGEEIVAVHVSSCGGGRGCPAPSLDTGHTGDRRRPLPAPA